jgi:inosine-uridine nucleoside N-ribohydrolase
VLTQKENDIRSGGYYFWDPLAAAIATQDSLGTFQELSVTVIEKEGPESGRTQVSDSGYKIRVTVAADRGHFETLLLDGLNGRLR